MQYSAVQSVKSPGEGTAFYRKMAVLNSSADPDPLSKKYPCKFQLSRHTKLSTRQLRHSNFLSLILSVIYV